MKLTIAGTIITASLFINWQYLPANEKAGISGFGMKSEIRDRVIAEQEDIYVTCQEQRGRICIAPIYKTEEDLKKDKLMARLNGN